MSVPLALNPREWMLVAVTRASRSEVDCGKSSAPPDDRSATLRSCPWIVRPPVRATGQSVNLEVVVVVKNVICRRQPDAPSSASNVIRCSAVPPQSVPSVCPGYVPFLTRTTSPAAAAEQAAAKLEQPSRSTQDPGAACRVQLPPPASTHRFARAAGEPPPPATTLTPTTTAALPRTTATTATSRRRSESFTARQRYGAVQEP